MPVRPGRADVQPNRGGALTRPGLCLRVRFPTYAPEVVLVQARGVSKAFGSGRAERTVLDAVDLEIAAGEMVAILGRSGSGKSTLVNLIGGIDRADAGSIEVCGLRLDGLDERAMTEFRRERIGFIFQLFHLIPELTGVENVLLPARLAGADAGAPSRGLELLERLELNGAADQLPHTLSGGEQQRIAIARALVNDPSLVLADEPSGSLDPTAGARVLQILRELAVGERSVVLVTHDTETATMADRVVAVVGPVVAPVVGELVEGQLYER